MFVSAVPLNVRLIYVVEQIFLICSYLQDMLLSITLFYPAEIRGTDVLTLRINALQVRAMLSLDWRGLSEYIFKSMLL